MRAIIVDDELLMVRKFVRMMADVDDLNIVGQFENAEDAMEFVKRNPIEIAFLDVEMPEENGMRLARRLREYREDMIIVFVTAYEEYIRESNMLGGDYYLVKPYSKKMLEIMMDKIRVLISRQQKRIYIQTFGRFLVKKDGMPVRLTGKAKEILAIVVTRRGKEISNEEIYSIMWEGRPYSNDCMSVYYNALGRLKRALKAAGISDLLASTTRGQTVNTALFDCDYYSWQDKKKDPRDRFEGDFMSEYSWGEYILADMLGEE